MIASRTRRLLHAVALAGALAVPALPARADEAAAADSTARGNPPHARATGASTTAGLAERIGLLRTDRLQHASLAWTLGMGAGLASREASVAIVVPLALGLAKELDDTRGSGFDTVDLLADTVGALAAGWLIARRP